ncbi:vegetative cell wall protein gp1-like isoform X2, partial [Daubentonia madagascariensis]
PE